MTASKALLLALAGSVSPAAAQGVTACPEQIRVEQHATGLPAGLSAFDSEPEHAWVNVQFSDGPPDEQAWLAPDSTRKLGKTFMNTWRFTASQGGIWLACGYTGTSIVAAWRLPAAIRACDVNYDTTVSPPAATAVTCR